MKPELIRAARGALDWSQTELAERADVHFQTIVSIEKGASVPSSATLNKIRHAFERNGLEIEGSGLRFVDDTIIIIEGEKPYLQLLTDVFHTLKNSPGQEILIANADDKMSPQDVNDIYRKLRASGIKMRQLVQDGNTYLMGDLSEYRYIPKEYFSNRVSLTYADKTAVVVMRDGKEKILIVKDHDFVELHKNMFNWLWSMCEIPKRSTADERF